MQLAFILDPLDSIKSYKDSSYAMMEEAARRGHALFAIHQEGLLSRDGRAWVQAGAGIVADSDPESEWRETEAKARAVVLALALALRR